MIKLMKNISVVSLVTCFLITATLPSYVAIGKNKGIDLKSVENKEKVELIVKYKNKNIANSKDSPSLRKGKVKSKKLGKTNFENGSGKSTLLEAIANNCGFAVKGGGRGSTLHSKVDNLSLSSIITLSWLPKVSTGFFLRAETFFDFASYIDELAEDPLQGKQAYLPYGGKSLHEQSHGEAFLSLLINRFSSRGIYILDEPESALSPQRQLSLLRIIWELERSGNTQFLIATHSPVIMAYPNADIYSLDETPIKKIAYEDT